MPPEKPTDEDKVLDAMTDEELMSNLEPPPVHDPCLMCKGWGKVGGRLCMACLGSGRMDRMDDKGN